MVDSCDSCDSCHLAMKRMAASCQLLVTMISRAHADLVHVTPNDDNRPCRLCFSLGKVKTKTSRPIARGKAHAMTAYVSGVPDRRQRPPRALRRCTGSRRQSQDRERGASACFVSTTGRSAILGCDGNGNQCLIKNRHTRKDAMLCYRDCFVEFTRLLHLHHKCEDMFFRHGSVVRWLGYMVYRT